MKKRLQSHFIITILMLCSMTSMAQLSGAYTINGAVATGGTNYQTFSAAVSALTTNGVSGAVIFNVQTGTYIEQITIPAIAGASTTNTITFKGLGATTLLTATPSATNLPMISLNSASHITIQDLKIEITGTLGWGVHFMNHADTNTVTGCIIEGPAQSGMYGLVGSGSPSTLNVGQNNGEYLTFSDNTIKGFDVAIQFEGMTGPLTSPSNQINYGTDIEVTNNIVTDFRGKGANIDNYHNLYFEGNTFSTAVSTSNGGVSFWDAGDNIVFVKNKVYIASNASNTRLVTIAMEYPNGPAGDATKPGLVANNFLQYAGTHTNNISGLYLKNKAYIKVYHNTFSINNNGSTVYCVWFDANNSRSLEGIELRNNIFTFRNSNVSYFFHAASNGAAFKNMLIDHNNFYTPGIFRARIPNGFNSTITIYTSFNGYKSSQYGTGALNVDPEFASVTDLHASSVGMNDSAAVIASITTDIDGDARSTTHPDIGADEYSLASCVAPFSVYMDDATATSARINFLSVNTGIDFLIEYGPAGFSQGSGHDTATATGHVITGLSPNTSYDFYIKSDCSPSGNGVSTASGPYTIQTLCLFSNYYYSDWDYLLTGQEEFCWELVAFGNGSEYAKALTPSASASLQPFSGINYYEFYNSTKSINFLVSPEMTDLTTNTLQIRFQGSDTYTSSTGTPQFYIGTMASISDTASFVPVDTLTTITNVWTEYTVELTSVPANHKHVVIRHANNANYVRMSIDNLSIESIPACNPPSAGVFSHVIDTSVVLSWGSNGVSSTYDIDYGPAGYFQGGGTILSGINNLSDTINGLLPNTCYDFYIRGNCTNINSPWYGPVSVCTPCAAVVAPFAEDFEGATWVVTPFLNEIDDCWERTSDDINDYTWNTNSGPTASPNSGPISGFGGSGKYLYTEATNGNPNNRAILKTPEIDFSSLTQPTLTFSYHMYGQDIEDFLVILENSAQKDTIWSVNGAQHSADTSAWTTAYIDITAYKSQVATLSFVGKRGFSFNGDIAIDELSIDEYPTCLLPTNFVLDSVYSTFADFSWFSQSNGTAFKMEYGPSGFSQGSGVSNLYYASTSPTQLTGLTPNTRYDIYLADMCDSTSWIGPVRFTTLREYDAELTKVVSPLNLYCGDSSMVVEVEVQNNGLSPITTVNVGATISGAVSATVSAVYTTAIAPGQKATIALGMINSYEGGLISVKAYANLANDQEAANDTLVTNNIRLISVLPMHLPVDTLCANDTDGEFIAVSQDNIIHNWYNNMADVTPFATGDTISGVPNQTVYLDRSKEVDQLLFDGPSGYRYGNMFKLYVKEDILFTGFSFEAAIGGTAEPIAFYKQGNFVGHETKRGDWTVLDSATMLVTAFSQYRLDFNSPVQFNAGDTVSIYLANKRNTRITWDYLENLTAIGDLFMINAEFEYYAGVTGSYFGSNLASETAPSAAGSMIHYISSQICGNNRIALTMGVNNDTALASFTSLVDINGADVSFDASASTGQVFDWNFGDGNTGTGMTSTNTYAGAGSYTVTLTVTDTVCNTIDVITQTVLATVSVEESLLSRSLNVYPNPNSGAFKVSFDVAGIQEIELAVLNTIGQIVYQENVGAVAGTFTRELAIENLAPGVYFLRVIANGKPTNVKMTVL